MHRFQNENRGIDCTDSGVVQLTGCRGFLAAVGVVVGTALVSVAVSTRVALRRVVGTLRMLLPLLPLLLLSQLLEPALLQEQEIEVDTHQSIWFLVPLLSVQEPVRLLAPRSVLDEWMFGGVMVSC